VIEYEGRSWLRIVLSLRGSIVPRLIGRVFATAALGAVAVELKRRTGLHLPVLVHSLLGLALGLLLVFRTNTSYDRFWEGRRLLGMYTNRARDLARQLSTFVEGDGAEALRARLLRLVALHYAITCQGLRGERDLSALGDLCGADERAKLEPCEGRPMLVFTWLSQEIARAVRTGHLPEARLLVIDPNLTSISDSWGGAERILRTPIPFAYAQHIKLFLVLFCFSVPFAMVESMGWLTPLAAAIVGFALFGIDEIGVEIEDPFGHDANDLPLDRIGETIRRDLEIARSA
jgi:putative membrane protein